MASWQDPENPPPGSLFELDFQPASYVRPGSDEERKGSHKMRPLIQIDYGGIWPLRPAKENHRLRRAADLKQDVPLLAGHQR